MANKQRKSNWAIIFYYGRMNPEPDLTTAITTEIACSIRTLGGNPETLDLTDTWQVNRTLGFLGADIYLMATVGSWQDTLTDQEVLDDLLTWNAANHSHQTSHSLRQYRAPVPVCHDHVARSDLSEPLSLDETRWALPKARLACRRWLCAALKTVLRGLLERVESMIVRYQLAITTHSADPTGAITLPTQFTRFKNAPSGWAAVCPWTALLVAGAPPRFCAWISTGDD